MMPMTAFRTFRSHWRRHAARPGVADGFVMPFVAACAVALLSACGSAPTRPSSDWVGLPPEQLVSEILAAGEPLPGELDVRPLRDPMVEDLIARADQAVAQHRIDEAAADLDKALALSPQDPALLQTRAEVAVLQRDLAHAAELSRRAYDLGAKVGPLCRREMMTVRQWIAQQQGRLLRLASDNALKGEKLAAWERDSSAMAQALADVQNRQAACTVTGPPRY